MDYLLCTSHADGRIKAAFFMRFGFSAERWEVLAAALKEVGVSNRVAGKMDRHMGRATLWMDRCGLPMAERRWYERCGLSKQDIRHG